MNEYILREAIWEPVAGMSTLKTNTKWEFKAASYGNIKIKRKCTGKYKHWMYRIKFMSCGILNTCRIKIHYSFVIRPLSKPEVKGLL